MHKDSATHPLQTEQVWRLFSAPLLRWFEGRTGNAEHAEELLAQTFLRIHETLPALRESDRLAAWVHTLARNIWQDALRARSHGTTELAAEVAEDESETLLLEEVASWVKDFLLQLSAEEQQLLQAVDWERQPLKQVARELGISESAVKSRVRRARAALRTKLEACCHVEWDRFGEIVDYHRRDGVCRCESNC
jgi:RNA polymerase sigma-70 factor (ECF subfamily)